MLGILESPVETSEISSQVSSLVEMGKRFKRLFSLNLGESLQKNLVQSTMIESLSYL